MTQGDRTPAAGLDPAGAGLTEAQLAAIEQRARAATDGPWYPFVSPWPDKMHAVTATDATGPPVAYVGNTLLGGRANDANLRFIAHARDDLDALVAALRAAWAEARRVTAERDAAVDAAHWLSLVKEDLTLELEAAREEERRATARADRHRAALEHYADEANWIDYVVTGGGSRIDCGEASVYEPNGPLRKAGNGYDVARAALAGEAGAPEEGQSG